MRDDESILTLAYIFDHAVCRKFGPKLASHYMPVENEVKLVRTMFGKLKVQLKNES